MTSGGSAQHSVPAGSPAETAPVTRRQQPAPKALSRAARGSPLMATKAHPLVDESVRFHRRVLAAELKLARERLAQFERRHGFTSAQFEKRFEAGKLGDDREWFDWSADITAAKALEAKLAALRS